MATTLLVSEIKLKSFTNINKNVDIDLLRSEILVAQDTILQNILGGLFYRHMLSGATTNTLNSDETELLNEYIQPALIHAAYYTAIPHIHYRTMNRGIVVGDMESAKAVDFETMKYLRNIQKERADFYIMRLQDYLILGYGIGKFQTYMTQTTLDGMLPDRKQGYNNGIYLAYVTRKGYNEANMMNSGIQGYSDLQQQNPPGMDCI